MGGSNTVYQKFEEVEGTFKATLDGYADRFKQDVFNLVMNSNNPTKIQGKEQFGSKVIPELGEGDVKAPPEPAKAKVDVKDANGKPIDGNKPTPANAYIEIYSKQNINVSYSENKDYKDVKAAVDEYAKDLDKLIGVGSEAATAGAAGGPLGVVSSLFSNSKEIIDSIGSVVKTSLNLASTSSGVGITQNTDTTFLPGGVYVCNLVYTSKAQLKTAFKTETVSMSICYTICATSTDLINTMRNQELIAKQFTFISKLSLDVMAKQGELLGWSDVYPKFITLAASGNKIKCGKTAATMDAELAAMPWKSTQEPNYGASDLSKIDVYSKALTDYKNYGRYVGYKNARDFIASLIDDVETDEEVKELFKAVKADLNELKTNTASDYDRFYKSYSDSLDKLRAMLGFSPA